MKKEKLVLSKNTFSETMNWLEQELCKAKISQKEILTAQLLLEETFLRLSEGAGNPEDFSVTVALRRRFGDISLLLEANGEPYNPMVEMTEVNEEEEDAYGLAVLKAHRNQVGYSRKNGKNLVSIKVHESSTKDARNTFIGIVLGIVCGILLKGNMSAAVLDHISVTMAGSVLKMFMNALSMTIGPMIFISVIAGITNMSNAADIGRMGGKLIVFSLVKLFCCTVVAVVFGLLFFAEGLPGLAEAIPQQALVTKPGLSLLDIITGIIPANLIQPFSTGNVLQMLFLACLFGVFINRAGEQAQAAKALIEFLNVLFMDIMNVVVKFIPVVVFFSMMQFMLTTGTDALVSLGIVFVAHALDTVLVIFVSGLFVALAGSLSPVPFLKKVLAFAPVPFSLNSSNACIPLTLKLCSEKLGVDSRLAMFSIPVGLQFNMNGSNFYITMLAVLMARSLGLELNLNVLVTLTVSAFLISVTMAGCPGSGIIALCTVFETVGIPTAAVAIFLPIESIVGMFSTVSNVTSDVASTMMLASSEKQLDKDVYMAK
jgi:Na+/H+-dicarboxylate symporter